MPKNIKAQKGKSQSETVYHLYFAYGSNLNVSQMQRRCPTAQPAWKATLTDWRLQYRGVLNIVPALGEKVEGAVWWTTDRDEIALDKYEGCDKNCGPSGLYRKEIMKVECEDGVTRRAYVYIMNDWSGYRERESAPSTGYLKTCVEGCLDFGIDPRVMLDPIDRIPKYPQKWVDDDEFEAYYNKRYGVKEGAAKG